MVDLARIAGADWAVAAQIGPAFSEVVQFSKLPPRIPRLLVPVDLQALVVPVGGTVGTKRGDIRSRMLDENPSERLADPFSTAPDLAPGVHLHWAMPDGLTKANPPDPGDPGRDLGLRPLPDRWLVCRLNPGGKDRARTTTSWVVHSDSAVAHPLATWDPDDPGDPASSLAPGQFTAATGGDLGWAGIYDNVVNRLAFHDDLAGVPANATLCYVVVGWYAYPALDPLHPPTSPGGFTALLADLGWDADLSALPDVEDTLTVADSHLNALARQAGVEIKRAPGGIVGPQFGLAEAGAVGRFDTNLSAFGVPPLGLADLTLDPEVALVKTRREPRVTSSLYHGTVYGVRTAGGSETRPGAPSVSLTLGSTGVDVLSRMLAGTDEVGARLLDAFSYQTLREFATGDGIVAHDEAVHRHGFAVLPDPAPGVAEKVRDPVLEPPLPSKLGARGADEVITLGSSKAGALAIGFSATWQGAQEGMLSTLEDARGTAFAKEPSAGAPLPGGGRPGGGRPTDGRPGAGRATFSSIVRPNPRWYAPTEPVLAVRGAGRSQRHGYDGRFDPGETLACRLSGQPVRGYAHLIAGRQVVAPLGHGGLPVECDELVREAALSDPAALDHLVSLVPPALGWSTTQVKNRLAAESVLDRRLATRDGDVGELLDASLKEGVQPSPVGITYWSQPWVPIYAEWQATLAVTDTALGWTLGEIDLEPRSGPRAPSLDPVPLAGRSLLNSSSARNLASAVDVFLDQEETADQNGTGIVSDADAEDLGDLALRAARADVLVGSLSGINDHFLGFDADATFDDPGSEPITSPARLPQLLRAGWLRLEQLRLVDAYGRTLDLTGRLPSTALADALVADPVPAAAAAANATPPAHLPPRMSTPARLQLRFLDAGNDAVEARVDESTPIHSRNPVAGWLLPDHGDDAMEFFDAAGNPLGQLFHRGLRSAVTWEGAPGRPGPVGAGPAEDLAGSVHLGRLAVALVQRDAAERAAGLEVEDTPLGALLRAVDTTVWSADPVGSAGTAPVSVLVGRPIAVVRLRLRLELYDDSLDYRLTPDQVAARQAAYAAAAERGVTVRLGALSRFDDGTLGYFADDDYSVFHPAHAAIRELAREGGAQRGFLDEVESAKSYGDTLGARRIEVPFLAGDPDLTVRPGRDVTLTVLTLAGLGINATCGLVPRKRLELNRSWTDEALQKLLPSFRVGPVLVDPSQIRMPRISAVPDAAHGSLENTWTRRDTPVSWREDPILAASMAARLVDRPAVAHEGWVRLVVSEND